MNIRELIQERIGSKAVLFDGCDDAIIGTSEGVNCPNRVVYSHELLVAVFERQGMSLEEAAEWVEYNVSGCGLTDGPIIMVPIDRDLLR